MSIFSEKLRLDIILPLAERIKGTNATYWYKQIQIMKSWSKEEVRDWQETKLRNFIRHAYEHTVYYRNLFDSLSLKPEDIQCAEDLKKLPILTKDIIRTHYDDLVADDVKTMKYRVNKTGGTSGMPMQFLCNEDVWGYVTAAKIDGWKQIGYRYGDKFAALGSSSILNLKPSWSRRIYDCIRREYGYNSLSLSDEKCAIYLEDMRKKGIHYVYGYASAIYILAKYAKDHKVDASFIRGVYTTSENLTDVYRKTIEETFHCRVMDTYGARDAGVAAYEVLPGKYPLCYCVIPEVIDEIAPNTGTFLTTCFLNDAFPLIRYDFGDVVTIEKEDSNFNTAILTKIIGRKSDVLYLDNGRVLTSPGFTILMMKFDVVAYEIQKISGSDVRMQIQPEQKKWTSQQADKLQAEMQRFVGEDCKFSIEYVDHFEPLKNGKRRYFMNDLSK
ncbi:MAG: phenylacetate--CoA ligase family protein [Prevotellaceae bacterium]|nr:phenylacetate--CoA ligase family protein [Candidatus Faecinaster equi]